MNNIWRKLTNLSSTHQKEKKLRRTDIYIYAIRKQTGYCFGAITLKDKSELEAGCKAAFNKYPESDILNVVYTNNKTRIIYK